MNYKLQIALSQSSQEESYGSANDDDGQHCEQAPPLHIVDTCHRGAAVDGGDNAHKGDEQVDEKEHLEASAFIGQQAIREPYQQRHE